MHFGLQMHFHCICQKLSNFFCKFIKGILVLSVACVLLCFGSTYKSLCVCWFVCCCCSIPSMSRGAAEMHIAHATLGKQKKRRKGCKHQNFLQNTPFRFWFKIKPSQWQCCWVLHCSHPNILIPCGSAQGPDVISGCGTCFIMWLCSVVDIGWWFGLLPQFHLIVIYAKFFVLMHASIILHIWTKTWYCIYELKHEHPC